MLLPVSLLLTLLPSLALALPSPASFLASKGLIRRQTQVPAACAFVCTGIQTALGSCSNQTCLCNEAVLESFFQCSECTLAETSPSNVNVSIASYQASIDAYRTSCASASDPVVLPNVTVTVPPANATYSTGLPANASSTSLASSASLSSSATLSSSSSSSSPSSVALSSSASRPSSSEASAGASASASASSTQTGAATPLANPPSTSRWLALSATLLACAVGAAL